MTIIVVGRVQHNHAINHGHHGTPVAKDGGQAGIGPSVGLEQAEEARNEEDAEVVYEGHGSLEAHVLDSSKTRYYKTDRYISWPYLSAGPAQGAAVMVHLLWGVLPRAIRVEVAGPLEAAQREVDKGKVGELEAADDGQEDA